MHWTTTAAILCRYCAATWHPGPDYLALERELRTADLRRTRTYASAA